MKYLGIKISSGLALANTLFIEDQLPDFSTSKRIEDSQIESEKKHVKEAIQATIQEYDQTIATLKEGELKELTEFNKMMLLAESLFTEISAMIEEKHYSGVTAIQTYFEQKAAALEAVDNIYLQERSKDVKDAGYKLIRKFLNLEEFDADELVEDVILVAKEITPSMLLSGDVKHVKGLISEIGGRTSHVGILANTLEIPAVFGIQKVDKIFQASGPVFLDGNHGFVETELSKSQIEKYKRLIQRQKLLKKELEELKDQDAYSKDHKRFLVSANAGDLSELDKLSELTFDGIGLFRTEFLYLNRSTPPEEEYLFKIYQNFVAQLNGKSLIIRTLDIGGDKKCPYIEIEKEANPFLGYRAIRYCLDHPDFFKVSLKAILRASFYGPIKIMYPMISSIEEVQKANHILEEAKQELREQQIPFDETIEVGIMVEVPAAVITLDQMIKEIDFVSIGTNDLVQYTLAVDRVNPTVSYLYHYYHPAVLRVIKHTIDVTKHYPNKFVGMCGEMAADPLGIIVLVGMGLEEFSVNLASILKVKKFISLIDSKEAKKIVHTIMSFQTTEEIETYLKVEARRIYGKYYED